ncbi:hypothetical protein [Butyrivibrio proteoclasticus]|uniref:hypothetical protein n=1 Tax=Butyrivibrio proteoclasticus TaxID=43305 RepID=UPI00047DAD01|nr:hypothetical protein [Butyrivibrio proteoclasticus]
MNTYRELTLKALKKSNLCAGYRDYISNELEKLWSMNTGKVSIEEVPDNRGAEPIDITDEFHHEEHGTITCPHCGLTLDEFVVMPHRYCYMCGGKFGERNLRTDKDDYWIEKCEKYKEEGNCTGDCAECNYQEYCCDSIYPQ